MKIITIGLDRTILDKNSPVAERFKQYGSMVERYDVVVPGTFDVFLNLSESVSVYGIGGLNKLVQMFRLVFMTNKLIKCNKYDIISTRDFYYVGLAALYFARKYHLGLEIQVHGFEKLNFVRSQIAKWILPRAHGIRTVGERLKRKLTQEFCVSPEKITVSPIFVDGEFFKDQSILLGDNKFEDREYFTFVTVGRLVPIKNISLQIRALAVLVKKYYKIRLIIIGDGIGKGNLKALVMEFGLEENVTFAGFVKDVSLYLHEADCFVLTSFEEGYGLAPIEAVCFGLPVIMTDVGCAGDIIVDKINGLIIPVNNERLLISAMEEIIENSKLREDIRRNNKDFYQKLPTFSETLNLYHRSWKIAMSHKNMLD